MAWVKLNDMQRKCGDYVIAKNHCSLSNLKFALIDKNGKFLGQFERFDDAIKYYDGMTK